MTMTRLRKTPDGVYLCGKCGWRVDDQETPWMATCPVCPTVERPSYVMVGDLIERALTKIGITKPLVEKLTRTAGKPGGCGCEGRKRWMNEAGVMVQKKAHTALLVAKDFYLGK